MKAVLKTVALFGVLGLLSGCSGGSSGSSEANLAESSEASSPEATETLPAVNEGFLRACLFFKNQDGYVPMAQSFYDDKRAQTVSSWTQGLPDAYKTEVENFFSPYDEDWGRSLIMTMAFDDTAKESTEWINLQIKCLANNIEIEFPENVY